MYRFLRFPNHKMKALTLSYDDGVVFDERLIEIMQKNGLKGTFNLNSGYFSKSNARRLNYEQALKLYNKDGIEVAVHGVMHYSLAEMDSAVAIDEIVSDRKYLENMFGRVVQGMAYANGSCNEEVASLMKACSIKYARTTKSTLNFDLPTDWLLLPATCHHKNPELMDLARKFVDIKDEGYWWKNTPKLFYLWGHSYEFNDNNNWEIIEEFASFMGNREDIWYATNGEIYDYVQAYNRLEWAAGLNFVYNPSAIDVYLDFFGEKLAAKAGQTLELSEYKKN